MANMELDFIIRGNVPGGFKRDVASTLRDCYKRFGSRVPYKVEVYIVDTETNMRDFLREEKFRLGISTGGDDGSICSYDVLRGYPRLIVCEERLAKFSKVAKMGVLRHEAAHTVLHGTLEYNIFRIPDDCRHIAAIKGIDSTILDQILFQLSLAVKDFEATTFLVQHDFVNCQFAFAIEWIQPSEEDKSAWKLTKTNRQAKFVYQSALMRPILFTHPLLALPKSKKISLEQQVKLGRRVEELIEYLGEIEENRVLQVANAIIEVLTEDTHKNVDTAFHQLMNLA